MADSPWRGCHYRAESKFPQGQGIHRSSLGANPALSQVLPRFTKTHLCPTIKLSPLTTKQKKDPLPMISTTTAISRRQQIATQFTGGIAIAFLAIATLFVAPAVLRADPVTGAIFTSKIGCADVNDNTSYGAKSEVYINGGPAHPGAAR